MTGTCGVQTHGEILQQPDLWPDTVERVSKIKDSLKAVTQGIIALLLVLGSGELPNGLTGYFYPDNFTFGQTVYLSPIYAAARSVAGVKAVTATKFQPQGADTAQFLNSGEISMMPLQVARLANDPSYPDHGKLTLDMEGGK